MSEDESEYWFPAKRYGWGWGPPAVWQGWVALLAFIAILVFVVVRYPPHRDIVHFLVGVFGATLGLVLVCWWKGEPPRWRWGDDDR